MPPAQTKEVIESQLNAKLEQVFEWINLEKPLGSASISQVIPSLHVTSMGIFKAWEPCSSLLTAGLECMEVCKRISRTLSLHWLANKWPGAQCIPVVVQRG